MKLEESRERRDREKRKTERKCKQYRIYRVKGELYPKNELFLNKS